MSRDRTVGCAVCWVRRSFAESGSTRSRAPDTGRARRPGVQSAPLAPSSTEHRSIPTTTEPPEAAELDPTDLQWPGNVQGAGPCVVVKAHH
jgi:hypothetical protein